MIKYSIEVNENNAEVECYEIATSSHDGKSLNFLVIVTIIVSRKLIKIG